MVVFHSTQNVSKTILFRVAHNYIAYVGKYSTVLDFEEKTVRRKITLYRADDYTNSK